MTKLPRLLVVLAMSAACASAFVVSTFAQEVRSQKSSNRNQKLGFLEGKNEGCGCSFTFSREMEKDSPRLVFTTNTDEKIAFIHVAGRDYKLNLVRSQGQHPPHKVGDRVTRIYQGRGIRVSAVYVAMHVCEERDDTCDVIVYDGIFTVSSAGQKLTARLKGGCECLGKPNSSQ